MEELVKIENNITIASWTDQKKTDFVKTFKQRSEASEAILLFTAQRIMQTALEKKFISRKHSREFEKDFDYHYYGCYGGRDGKELYEIAQSRADQILKELPPLKKVVSIVTPEIAKKIEERDKIVAEGQKLVDKLDELSEPIKMSDLDQNMTIGSFRQLVKTTEKKRKQLVEKLNELGTEGRELDSQVDKALYAGIPGLTDAVIKTIRYHVDKAKSLGNLTRRVEEQVMFGDSNAALEILRTFEGDEAKVADEVKDELKSALDTLMNGKKKA